MVNGCAALPTYTQHTTTGGLTTVDYVFGNSVALGLLAHCEIVDRPPRSTSTAYHCHLGLGFAPSVVLAPAPPPPPLPERVRWVAGHE